MDQKPVARSEADPLRNVVENQQHRDGHDESIDEVRTFRRPGYPVAQVRRPSEQEVDQYAGR